MNLDEDWIARIKNGEWDWACGGWLRRARAKIRHAAMGGVRDIVSKCFFR